MATDDHYGRVQTPSLALSLCQLVQLGESKVIRTVGGVAKAPGALLDAALGLSKALHVIYGRCTLFT